MIDGSSVVNAHRQVIDAHVHIWDLPDPIKTPFPYRSATRETLLAEMDDAGAQRAVLVQPGVCGDDHTYLQEAVSAFPERFSAVALLDPFSPRVLSRFDDVAAFLIDTGHISERDSSDWISVASALSAFLREFLTRDCHRRGDSAIFAPATDGSSDAHSEAKRPASASEPGRCDR